MFCWGNDCQYSSALFLYLLSPYRCGKRSWISLRHRSRILTLFSPFDDSFKAHRDIYVKFVPRQSHTIPFWAGPDNQPLFPLYWTMDHYSKSLSLDELECRFLEEGDRETYQKLCNFLREGGIPIHCRDVLGAPRRNRAACLCITPFYFF